MFCWLPAQSLNFRPSPVAVRQSLMLSQPANIYDTSDIKINNSVDLFTGQSKSLTLYSITIEGSSIFTDENVLELAEKMIGQEITTADLETLAQKLTELYHKKGYIFCSVYVPFQPLKHGTIRLKAVEQSIIKTSFRWINMPSHEDIKKQINDLKKKSPFNIRDLEPIIATVRQKAGLSISFTLKDIHEDGRTGGELIAIVSKQGITHKVGVANTMPESLGNWVARGDVQFNSLFGIEDQLKVFGAVYPTHKFNHLMHYGSEFSVPINKIGTKFFMFADLLRDQPDLRSQGLALARGRLKTYGGGFEQGLSLKHNVQGNVRFVIDRKNFSERTISNQGLQRDIQQKNLAFRLMSHFEMANQKYGDTIIDTGYHHGLKGDHSYQRGTDQRGALAFRKLTASARHIYNIDDTWAVVGSMRGQYALNKPLLMERFFYGGAPFSFANPIGILVGDSGVQGKVEIRYGISVDEFLKKMTFYSYLETGKVWNRGLKPQVERTDTLSGMGVGIRGLMKWGLSAFLEYGIPSKQHVDQNKIKNQIYSGLTLSNKEP